MAGQPRQPRGRHAGFMVLLLCTLFLSGCFGGDGADTSTSFEQNGPITLTVWHTFAAESK